jgi:hypothetical protein
MPPVVVCGSAANRSTCCGAQRRAGFVWRGMELFPILVAGENRYARKPGFDDVHAARAPLDLWAPPDRHGHPPQAPWRRPTGHPGRNFQPTVRIGAAQVAAKNSAIRPLDRRVNADPKTKPGMPWVQRFSRLGSVGVLKLCCITTDDRIRALTAPHPIKPISASCRSAWQPTPGRRSTYRRGDSVQKPGPPLV